MTTADDLLDRARLLSEEILDRERFIDTVLSKLWDYEHIGYVPGTPESIGITHKMKAQRDDLVRRAKMIESG